MHCTQTSFLQEEASGEAAQKCEQPRRWASAKSPSTGVSPAALLLPALSPGLPQQPPGLSPTAAALKDLSNHKEEKSVPFSLSLYPLDGLTPF